MEVKDIFYYPFLLGTVYLFAVVIWRFVKWFLGLSKIDKMRVRLGLFSKKTLKSIWESICEGLLSSSPSRSISSLSYPLSSIVFKTKSLS